MLPWPTSSAAFTISPHGECNAILLPHVSEYNLIAARRRFGRIAKLLGERVDGLSAGTMPRAKAAREAIRILSKDVGILDGLVASANASGKEVREEDIPHHDRKRPERRALRAYTNPRAP